MTALASPFVWIGVLSVTAGIGFAAVAWRQRRSRGARPYAILMAVLAVWSALYVGELLAPSVPAKRPWLVARHALSPLIAVLFWVFAARYVDRSELLSARYLGPILAVGAVVTVAPVVNPWGLYWTDLVLYTGGSFPRVKPGFGPAFWCLVVYLFAVVGGGHAYFVATLRDSFSVYRRQLAAMTVVGTIEFALLAIYLSEHVGVVPDFNPWPHVQLTTYNLVFVAAPLGWSYFRQSMFDLQVIDRQAVIESMDDAVFVFDTDDVVRSVNEAGRGLIDDPGSVEGRSASEVFAPVPVLLDAYRTGSDGGTGSIQSEGPSGRDSDGQPEGDPDSNPGADPGREPDPALGGGRLGNTPVTGHAFEGGDGAVDGDVNGDAVGLVVDGEHRWFDIRRSAIRDSAGERTGTVLVARDVTVRRRQRRMLNERTAELRRKTETLERQNEQLDQFAGIVSHDLRSPLQVAQGRLDLARDDPGGGHLDAVERALDRIGSMVDDLLTMARAGQTIDTTEAVVLADVARRAWGLTGTGGCELEVCVPDGVTIRADRDRLLHVFENLFRNAIDHNEPPLTVRVDVLRADGSPDDLDGVVVEDDGRGIPESDREAVFEHGYTNGDGGTGFGLSIVRAIVEAHGWDVRVDEGTAGGARFEITGLETPDDDGGAGP